MTRILVLVAGLLALPQIALAQSVCTPSVNPPRGEGGLDVYIGQAADCTGFRIAVVTGTPKCQAVGAMLGTPCAANPDTDPATVSQLAALAARVPTPASTVPTPATPAGKAGTSTAFVPADASEPSLTRSVRVATLADGTFSLTWSIPLNSAAPVANVVPINTGSQPAICNPTAVTAQGVAGRCWMLTTPTLSVLGAQVNVASASSAAGLTVSVYAREPSP